MLLSLGARFAVLPCFALLAEMAAFGWLGAGAAMADPAPLALPPGAVLALEQTQSFARSDIPVAPWQDGTVPSHSIEGALVRQVWRIDDPGISPLQIAVLLRDQLIDQGYAIDLDCLSETCGGFDFRFAIDVAPPPEMFVDLGDFNFVSARTETGDAASVLVSRSAFAVFAQIIRVSPGDVAAPAASSPADPSSDDRGAPASAVLAAEIGADAISGDFAAELANRGRVVLRDLSFETGSAALGPGPYASLDALAAFLRAAPGARVALVGHTDADGPLDANITLSRRRAGSVRDRLVRDYGIPAGQLDAQGMGFLAPLATNLTPDGRDANRRVEVVILTDR